MYIAVDDTDSRLGMCTTYVLTEIIRRSGLDLIGYPRLVRLNPSIRHKTRGNGALCANLGTGTGTPVKVGAISGKPLLAYPAGSHGGSSGDLIALSEEIIGETAELQEPQTNPGIVASEGPFDASFYWKAVREELSIGQAEAFIRQQGGEYRKIKLGRGIIGAAAAIAWPEQSFTFEFLGYKYPFGEALAPGIKFSAAERAEEIEGSFNSIDRVNPYPAIFPKERTPVVIGVRGIYPDPLLEQAPAIMDEAGINTERHIVYRTNQGTDDHIITDPAEIRDGSSYSIEGTVNNEVYNIAGGHCFTSLLWRKLNVKVAAFEPTKEFRKVFSGLVPGDSIRVYGTYRDNCLNIEKMSVLALAVPYKRAPPLCTHCGAGMHSRGHNDYRCSSCGNRSALPDYMRVERRIKAGDYDVPVIARRHISRPFELKTIGMPNEWGLMSA